MILFIKKKLGLLPCFNPQLSGITGIDFQDVTRIPGRVIDRARIPPAGWDIILDIDNPAVFIKPDHIQRNQGIFHPERISASFRKNKKHPLAPAQGRPELQAKFKLLFTFDNFNGNTPASKANLIFTIRTPRTSDYRGNNQHYAKYL